MYSSVKEAYDRITYLIISGNCANYADAYVYYRGALITDMIKHTNGTYDIKTGDTWYRGISGKAGLGK